MGDAGSFGLARAGQFVLELGDVGGLCDRNARQLVKLCAQGGDRLLVFRNRRLQFQVQFLDRLSRIFRVDSLELDLVGESVLLFSQRLDIGDLLLRNLRQGCELALKSIPLDLDPTSIAFQHVDIGRLLLQVFIGKRLLGRNMQSAPDNIVRDLSGRFGWRGESLLQPVKIPGRVVIGVRFIVCGLRCQQTEPLRFELVQPISVSGKQGYDLAASIAVATEILAGELDDHGSDGSRGEHRGGGLQDRPLHPFGVDLEKIDP